MDRYRQKEWTLGLVFLLIVVILWVLSSFLVNDLLIIYPKPFLITYLNTTTFILYLLPYLLRRYNNTQQQQQLLLSNPDSSSSSSSYLDTTTTITNNLQHIKLSLNSTITLLIQFCILWYLSNFTTNASLQFTSVSSQTILSSTLSFFTLIIGYLTHVEKINRKKLIGLILSMIGIILVNGDDNNNTTTTSHNNNNSTWGNILLLSGAAGYGVYSILLKLKVPNHDNLDFQLFFGFVGIFNFIILWIPLIILHLTKIETLEWPTSTRAFELLLINASTTFISDYLWLKLMILTSPLTTTVGLSLTIPLLMMGDVVFNKLHISLTYLIGAVVIAVSFIIINKDEELDEQVLVD